MFRRLRKRLRLVSWRLAGWRYDLDFYWHSSEKGFLFFLVALLVPLGAVGTMARFAYLEQTRSDAQRQRQDDLTCLAENVYFEARGEPLAGQYAVAEVTLNRAASRQFPATICEVVHQKTWDPLRKRYVGAFSWTELEANRKPRGRDWRRALAAATAVYDNEVEPQVGGALFYHAVSIEPSWARTKKQVAKIGSHVFYR